MAKMVEIRSSNRNDLLSAVRADLRLGDDLLDVTLVAGDGGRIKAKCKMLTTWSPVVRVLLATSGNWDKVVFLPDFDSRTINKMLEVLEMEWEEKEEVNITREMSCLLTCFGIDLGQLEPARSCEEENTAEDSQDCWANVKWQDIKIEVEDPVIEDLEVKDIEKVEPMKIPQRSTKKTSSKDKCSKCGLTFNNRSLLKRHISLVHFEVEVLLKAWEMFLGDKCALCGKICDTKLLKKKHMYDHHNEVGTGREGPKNSAKGLIGKLQRGAKSKNKKDKEDIEKYIGDIEDTLTDQENTASADTFEEENSNTEVQTVLEQLMQMQDLSDDDDEDDIALERNGNIAKEKVAKKNANEQSFNPYVRRSLRVYSIHNPSLGNIVDQDI